ncbi:hypothetical protein ACJW30_11G148000 [Castanea mollissima]
MIDNGLEDIKQLFIARKQSKGGWNAAIFIISLYILAVGEGGHKPCAQTFAADQFDHNLLEETKAKGSFFNWWFFGITVGSTLAVLVAVYVEDNISWAAGFGTLTLTMGVSLAIFLSGIKKYRKQGPLGSPFTMVVQVLVAASRKWHADEKHGVLGVCLGDEITNVHLEAQPTLTRALAHTNQFRFLDKAMIIDDIDASSESRNPWRLCSLNQVEEVKLVLRLIPIWLSSIMSGVVATNFSTYFTKQVLVPITRKFSVYHSGITLLQRVGTGLCISLLTMVVAALVQAKRVSIAKQHDLMEKPEEIVPISVWWLLLQYILCGLADVFTLVGLQELFYGQMPESLRSLGAALYLSVIGIGSSSLAVLLYILSK